METKVFFQQRDGSIYDSLTKTVQYFDTEGNRYRNNFIDSSGKVIESEVSLFNEQYKLKSTVGQECQRYFHPAQMSLKRFLSQAFDESTGFFQYIGIDYPEFDSNKVYYKFTNGGDNSATTYYFDENFRLAWIKYVQGKGKPTEVHQVTLVKKRTFSTEDFMLNGCDVQKAEIMHDLQQLTPKMKEIVKGEQAASYNSARQVGGL